MFCFVLFFKCLSNVRQEAWDMVSYFKNIFSNSIFGT